MLDIFKYIVFGIVQGIIEPLPVSSKGHVLIFMNMFGVHMDSSQAQFFLSFIHLGSLAAFFIIYWQTIKKATTGTVAYFKHQDMSRKKDASLFMNVGIAFFISAAIIFTLDSIFNVTKSLFSGNSFVVAIGLLITACLLFYVEFGFDPKKQTKKNTNLRLPDAITIGLFQVLALIPGVTRSGSTLLGGMTRKLSKSEALNFSFLLFIPTILMANIYTMLKSASTFQISVLPLYLLALIAAFFSTFVGYRIIRFALAKNGLRYFAFYAIAVAILIFIFKNSVSGFFGDIRIFIPQL
ncbi:MAG: undecaprenyl-diphosphate phosphatase [Culicoidibacterales bacterium]